MLAIGIFLINIYSVLVIAYGISEYRRPADVISSNKFWGGLWIYQGTILLITMFVIVTHILFGWWS